MTSFHLVNVTANFTLSLSLYAEGKRLRASVGMTNEREKQVHWAKGSWMVGCREDHVEFQVFKMNRLISKAKG